MSHKPIDLLMIFPPGGNLAIPYFKYHLGSGYIIAYLKKHNFQAKQFISQDSYNINECIKKIIEINPKIVGFTVYKTNYIQSLLLSRALKKANSDIIIFFGGPTPSVHSKEILESNPYIDACIRWEGEETMLNMLFEFSENGFKFNNTNLEAINGITYRREKNIIFNSDRNILLSKNHIKNYLDEYPSPYLSGVIPASQAFPTGIITARGCNQNCIYCNCAILSKGKIFFHSTERVIKELKFISKNNKPIGPIFINDDSFTIIPSRARSICEQIISNNIKLPLSCITRCDKITEDLLDLMKKAGFKSVGFSLESAVPRVLRTIGKVNPPNSKQNFDKEIEFIEKLKAMSSYAKTIGMYPVFVSIMLGLPGETFQDAQETISFVKQLDIDFYSHNHFHIYKGTPIYKTHKKYGYQIKPIGLKNKINTHNSFPFDLSKIKLAPKSANEQNYKEIDYKALKILSLNTIRKNEKPFFDNVIINSDNINSSLIEWMQKNLAINGAIIQLFSTQENYKKLNKNIETSLYNELSPSLNYQAYYKEDFRNYKIIKPGRMLDLGEEIGYPIKITNTFSALEEYSMPSRNMDYLICTDFIKSDTKALYRHLIEISEHQNSFNYLLDSKLLPQFQYLCRWTTNQANCHKFETAIIGNDASIRICWHSDPIGTVKDLFSDIKQYILSKQEELEEKRNCSNCMKNINCVKCIFPYPLTPKEYCELKNLYPTPNPADLLHSFNILKDFIFKPINPLDF